MSKVWFITGASRGLGTDVAKAVLDAGYKEAAFTQPKEMPRRSIAAFFHSVRGVA